ncbi:hypothetical protein [Psychroserpens algicola]|uniref:hypothetical protein n=1 Tax=Psychroserpens algicola TaxID=1719034 RepID=UPI001954D2B3|nr:hypothetical protein [Psychroserpens algicola]
MKKEDYRHIIVESFIPADASSRHGLVHIKPVANQEPFLESMFVQCSKELSTDYPIGTKFRIKAKITSREGGTPFVSSHYTWKYEVLK